MQCESLWTIKAKSYVVGIWQFVSAMRKAPRVNINASQLHVRKCFEPTAKSSILC